MKRNDFYCYIDDTKLTEAEWNKVHAEEVKDGEDELFGYWHCDTFELYSKAFDECMAEQIKNRDSLRNWYVRLMKEPFTDKWAEAISDFSDSFKCCYGRRPNFIDSMLFAKGVTRKELSEAWERICVEG